MLFVGYFIKIKLLILIAKNSLIRNYNPNIPAGDMIGYFKKIDLGYDEATKEILVPSWRQDLLCDADMAEEVARFYGYDKIGTSLPERKSPYGRRKEVSAA